MAQRFQIIVRTGTHYTTVVNSKRYGKQGEGSFSFTFVTSVNITMGQTEQKLKRLEGGNIKQIN